MWVIFIKLCTRRAHFKSMQWLCITSQWQISLIYPLSLDDGIETIQYTMRKRLTIHFIELVVYLNNHQAWEILCSSCIHVTHLRRSVVFFQHPVCWYFIQLFKQLKFNMYQFLGMVMDFSAVQRLGGGLCCTCFQLLFQQQHWWIWYFSTDGRRNVISTLRG